MNHLWLALAALALAAGAMRNGSPAPKPGPGPSNGPALDNPAIWSLSGVWTAQCNGHLPVVPTASSGWGKTIRQGMTAPLMWAWTGPGQHDAVDLYPHRVIADVETYVEAAGASKWTGAGSELSSAAYLASRCPGVTSHGFVAPALKTALSVFAGAGCVGVPQVYDTDRSTLQRPGGPRGFLRQCVDSYAAVGFARVLPLLGLSAGIEIVSTWIDECEKIGVPWHLYSVQRLTPAFCSLVTA